MKRFWPACVVALTLAIGPAQAQDKPKLIPDRDVDLTYRVTDGSGALAQQRVRWLAAEHLLRREGPGTGFTLIDRKTDYITIVNTRTKSYVKVEEPAGGLFRIDSAGLVTKGGGATVAKLPCTEWSWVDTSTQQPRTVCTTDDGVMLRVTEAGRTLIEAISITYRKVNPKTFAVPVGYEPTLIPDISGQ